MKKTKKLKAHPLLFVLLITILLGGINSLFLALPDKKLPESYVASTSVKESLESPNLPSKEVSSDYLSTGERVIKTKTAYFENEVQVWLASEQACKSVGMGDACIKDLMGIAYTETRSFNYKAMGDGSKSYGAFQIHRGYHPEVTIEQATDPYWAAKWTIKRMIAYGYPKNRSVAIMKHNGTPNTPATLGYLSIVNKYINM